MGNVSRPLIGLLVATVAFFALWLVALKPSSSSNGGSGGLGQYQSAITAAHNAAKLASGAATAQGGNLAAPQSPSQQPAAPAKPASSAGASATPASSAPTSTTAATSTSTGTSTSATPTTPRPGSAAAHPGATRLTAVERALRRHEVVALLFFNPAAADDRAVRHELATVPGHAGRVAKFAVPLSELSNYTVLTNQVGVSSSPTLVLINHAAQATTIVGFADAFEIAQRVDDALAVK